MTDDILIVSFDIFDTLVTRSVATPTDIHFLIQQRLQHSHGRFPLQFVEDFVNLRRSAEKWARLKRDREDITIDDIYKEIWLKEKIDCSLIEEIKKIELESENEVIHSVQPSVDCLNAIRSQEKRVVFTSDMYLPEPLIHAILKRIGAFQQGDKIYLSGVIGLTKSSGNLFRYILAEERCPPQQMMHVGDNPYSDVWVPRLLGIKTVNEVFSDRESLLPMIPEVKLWMRYILYRTYLNLRKNTVKFFKN